jgi:hypothetical protein
MSASVLSPAEALFLIDPAFGDGRKALKLSLRWLIAHGVFNATREIRPGTWLFRIRPRLQLAATSSAISDLPKDLAELVELARSAPTDFFEDILPIIQWTYGASPSLLMANKIKQNLVARGLLACQPQSSYFGLGQHAYALTAAGKEVCERVISLLAQAQAIPKLITTDPSRVAAIAAQLDGLLLILTELRSAWGDIANAMRIDVNRAHSGFDLSRLDGPVLEAFDALIDYD